MHLDKKREEQLEKIEFELEKEYEQAEIEQQETAEELVATGNDTATLDELQPAEFLPMDNEKILQKKKHEMIFELVLFLVLGILLGITAKTEAIKRITIGFNDYLLPPKIARYNLDEIKSNLMQKAAAEQIQQSKTSNQ